MLLLFTLLFILCINIILSQSEHTYLSDPIQYTLPPLTFAYDALEPFMGKETVELHYSKHHSGYLTNFNKHIKQLWDKHENLRQNITIFQQANTKDSSESLKQKQLIAFLRSIESLNLPPALQTALINQGGGYINHNIFWETLRPPDSQPYHFSPHAFINSGPELNSTLLQFMKGSWGGFLGFEQTFRDVALQVFGSGWA